MGEVFEAKPSWVSEEADRGAIAALPAVCTRGKWKLNLVQKFKSNFDFGSVTEGQFSLKLDDPKSQIHKYANTHMTQGQFLQDGENVSFMSSRASV